ncbi:MAG: hypothetical protein ABIC68_00230 [Candidatus Omnitrophota bacterium]
MKNNSTSLRDAASTKHITYEIDPHNKLTSSESNAKTGVTKFRTVYDGTFKISPDNKLIYHIKESGNKKNPQQIKFSGVWSLDKNHNLTLTLDKWNQNCFNNKLTLKGDIKAVNAHQLVFCLTTKNEKSHSPDYLLKINGKWQADKHNQLSFKIEKSNALQKNITLCGAWDINKLHQISYAYVKKNSITKKTINRTLIFKGRWDINKKNRISYILNKALCSVFDFKITYAKTTPRGLQFSINFGPHIKRTIVLSGKWNICKNMGIILEISPGKKNTIALGSSYKLNKDSTIDITFKNNEGEGLGLTTKLSQIQPNRQGEKFLKILLSKKEIALTAGIGFRW